ncbi:glycoside hydrolase family 3 C-terminal domain-containing protein [Acetanaerobacterium elongatum]|uniref:Beta-glucosidase n=1 Tax=Acetanaerobacterium elongatum TaxID=258515 RepID=A0A1H0CU93_9FIRM|nr:glycoside hydrolase family 3 C-terminal domain-containing protein [Acetanaerobacterium elongatum]SDN61261.1 beta-glucosidase [Acetanaerobacterium elongatum]
MLNIPYLLKELTVEEKAGLCSGADFWHTKTVERLGLDAILVSDGPHGLRAQKENKEQPGKTETVQAVCYPSGAALAAGFSRSLMQRIGDAIGEEAVAEGVHTVLGPAINMKRSPLCGRNFEYLSEDPYVAGELAATFVSAVQAHHVGTSPKHFAANNQETRRMSVSAEVSERALREIYLTAFEKVVKNAKPWTMMCSYNRINGTYSCENEWLLSTVLRKEWGFDGIVMSDWGAVNHRVNSLKAGLELEMPSSRGERDKLIAEAVRNNTLPIEVLDQAVTRLLEWIDKGIGRAAAEYNREAHHELARKAACECAALLKNEGVLPLNKEQKVVFIGEFAEKPRYQGGGSSHINSFRVDSALDAAKAYPNVAYTKGFGAETDEIDDEALRQAVKLAQEAEVAVIFAGLPDVFESEGYDRTHLNLPECQNRLIEAVAAVQPNTVVVLHNGSPVYLPWRDKVNAILEMYLGGQAVGQATVDLLYGEENPSGKLAESFPLRLEDTSCWLNFPGDTKRVVYSEDIFIGYRWYDARRIAVQYPFGHGLSYTTFSYEDIRLSRKKLSDQETLQVSVTVKNTGKRAGSEIVQLYVAPCAVADIVRPIKELKGFEKVKLEPGEQKTVVFTLDKRSFAYYDTDIKDWVAPSGEYTLLAGPSSAELPLKAVVTVHSTTIIPLKITDTTTVGEVLRLSSNPAPLKQLLKRMDAVGDLDDPDALGKSTGLMRNSMTEYMPLHAMICFSDLTMEEIAAVEKTLK